jgi:hypothetical protein
MKLNQAIEKLVIWLAAGASVGVSLFHILGGFEGGSWLSEHIATLTLLLVAGLLPLLVNVIERKIANMQTSLEYLKESSQHSTVDQISSLLEGMDPSLRLVFGEHIADLLSSVIVALRERRIQLHDVDVFRHFYRRTLEKFPKTTLYATSLPLARFFWKNQQIEHDMANFIEKGGKIVRVFFLTGWEQLEEPEVLEILNFQSRIGVEVYVTNSRELPCHLKRLFLVENKGRIAWEVSVGPSHEITQIAATSDPKVTQRFKRDFEELREMESTQRFPLEPGSGARAA